MKRTLLPKSDLMVSSLAIGGGSFGTALRGDDLDHIINEYIDSGGNFIDTAHCYSFWVKNGNGASERALGDSLRRIGCREKVVIATKGGHSDGGTDYPRPANFLAPEIVRKDLDESLERLKFDYVDLYYLHRDDGVTPVEEFIDMLYSEVKKGRIRAYAASNWSIERLESANRYASSQGIPGFSASQMQWSLAEPTWRITADPTMRYITPRDSKWHSVAQLPVVAYTASAEGYFAGKGHSSGNFATKSNLERFERSAKLAHTRNCTTTQIAIAYLLNQPFPTIPLFSTCNENHLKEIAGSSDINLTLEELIYLKEGDGNIG